jgi:hypothetical protein
MDFLLDRQREQAAAVERLRKVPLERASLATRRARAGGEEEQAELAIRAGQGHAVSFGKVGQSPYRAGGYNATR